MVGHWRDDGPLTPARRGLWLYDPVQIGPRNSNRDSNGKETVISVIGTVSAAPRALVRERERFFKGMRLRTPRPEVSFPFEFIENDKKYIDNRVLRW